MPAASAAIQQHESPRTRAAALPTHFSEYRDYHRDGTILVCGCGASLSQVVAPEEFITIGVNDVGRLFHPNYLVVLNPRSQFSGDRFRYVENSQAGAIFTQLNLGIAHPNIVRFRLGQRGGVELNDNESLPYTRNSPYVALCLAIYMGARRIGLIGVDFTDHHFFARTGQHPLAREFTLIDREYKQLYEACAARSVEVFNLSDQSRLTALPRMSFGEFAALEKKKQALNVASYSVTPVAGVPVILSQCIAAGGRHSCHTVWASNTYGNGVTFEGDVEWSRVPAKAEELLRSADLIIVHNGKVNPSHKRIFAGKPVITMAHNYMWNVDSAFVQQKFPGVVVGQYQATLPEFQGWHIVPNPVPLWHSSFQPGAKNPEITICYTPSGKHEKYPPDHRLFWHSKGYATTMRVLERLASRFSIRLETITGQQVSHATSLAMKQRSHIVIDECVTGSYHRNSLEGLAVGCVVVNGLGNLPAVKDVFRQCSGSDQIPFVCANLETLEQVLENLIQKGPDALLAEGARNRAWMEEHWNFEKQWRRFWEPVVERALQVAHGNAPAPRTAEAPSNMIQSEPEKPATQNTVRFLNGVGYEVAAIVPISLAKHWQARERNFLACLQALNSQDLQRDRYRIIVVEQDSEPRLQSLAATLADHYIFAHNPGAFNRGWGFNVGACAAASAKSAFCLMDADMLPSRSFLSTCLERMRSGQRAVRPYEDVKYLDACSTEQAIQDRSSAYSEAFSPDKYHGQSFQRSRGGCLWVEPQLYRDVSGFDERFRGFGYEDTEFWDRLSKQTAIDVVLGTLLHMDHPRATDSYFFAGNAQLYREISRGRTAAWTGPMGDIHRYSGESAHARPRGADQMKDQEPADNNSQVMTSLNDVTIIITSFLRPGYLKDCLAGIKRNLPECKVIVVDDSELPPESGQGYQFIQLAFDSGLSAKRNAGLSACATKYLLMGSDDFDFSTSEARAGVEKLVSVLERHQNVDVAGGHHNHQPYEGFLEFVPGSHIKEIRLFSANQPERPKSLSHECEIYKVDLIVNYFLARVESIRQFPWDERMKIGGEHGDWFLTLKEAGKTVVWVKGVNINELRRDRSKEHRDYSGYRARAGRLGHRIFLEKRGIKHYFAWDAPVPATVLRVAAAPPHVEAAPPPLGKTLIAVITCKQNAARVAAQRDTWIPRAVAAGYNVEIFDGERLGVPDDYYSLVQKTKAVCSWALAHGYDRLLKVDDDSCIRVDQLLPNHYDYAGIIIGANDLGSRVPPCVPAKPRGTYPHNYASGGAYWLSRKAMTIVAEAEENGDWAEDRFVGNTLAKHGILVQRIPEYTWARSGRVPPRWTIVTQLATPALIQNAFK